MGEAMWHNVIGQRIQQSNRKQFLWALVVCFISVGLGWLLRPAVANLWFGPFRLDPNRPERYYVTFVPEQVAQTPFTVKSSKSGSPLAEYLLAASGNRTILIRAAMNDHGPVFTGVVRADRGRAGEGVGPAREENPRTED